MRFQQIDAEGFVQALAAERPPFVLDVRTAEEFEAGHVPGARHCPVHELSKRPKDLPSSHIERVLVIADTSRRAEAAANFLTLMGFADVAVVEGGLTAWRGELERGPPAPRPRPGPELRIVP